MNGNAVVIQKMTLEVTINASGYPKKAEEYISWLQDWLDLTFLPKLEASLVEHQPFQLQTLRLENLEIDLGRFSALDSLSVIPTPILQEHMVKALSSEQIGASESKSNKLLNWREREAEALIFFLKNGRLPWWKSPAPATMRAWEQPLWEALKSNPATLHKLLTMLRAQLPRRRFLASFSKAFLQKVASLALLEMKAESLDLQSVSHYLTAKKSASGEGETVVEQQHLDAFFEMVFGIAKPPLSENTQAAMVEQPAFVQPEMERTGTETEAEAAIYIRNAGLVLLHPFMQMLFEELGIAKDGKLLQPGRAIQLLQVLATGHTGPEYDLAFNKLLCGIEPDVFLKLPLRLTKKEMVECERLLKAAIGHWSKLGDTSPEGLRGTFLCRDGKLSRRPDGAWLLQVEQRGFDVLLADLPWSISMIKLPWMPDLLYVEWA
ncbi:MAG: contractile injection system tape measure protein [Saprospiraceae bacterium]|jgi:hypothetical protein|nr:contractile injection system tape measure protein [Saprospiraceae bacterium]